MPPNTSNRSQQIDSGGHDQGVLRSLGLPPPGELLPLGYLYLLVLGIANESIHYGLLGVNILEYSNALDVLLSPIALITGELAMLGVAVGVPLFLWPYLGAMRWWALKHPSDKNVRLRAIPLGRLWLPMCAIALVAAFLGVGVGQGYAQREDLVEGSMQPNTRLTFNDGGALEAFVVGINSGYVFYVLEGDTEVTISPIADNIQSLRALPDED